MSPDQEKWRSIRENVRELEADLRGDEPIDARAALAHLYELFGELIDYTAIEAEVDL